MYGNISVTDAPAKNKRVEEDPVLLAQFEARIAAGEKIEPGDWMPREYRRQLIRMIEQHAHSETIWQKPGSGVA